MVSGAPRSPPPRRRRGRQHQGGGAHQPRQMPDSSSPPRTGLARSVAGRGIPGDFRRMESGEINRPAGSEPREQAAEVFAFLERDAAAVNLGDVADDGQAEPGARLAGRVESGRRARGVRRDPPAECLGHRPRPGRRPCRPDARPSRIRGRHRISRRCRAGCRASRRDPAARRGPTGAVSTGANEPWTFSYKRVDGTLHRLQGCPPRSRGRAPTRGGRWRGRERGGDRPAGASPAPRGRRYRRDRGPRRYGGVSASPTTGLERLVWRDCRHGGAPLCLRFGYARAAGVDLLGQRADFGREILAEAGLGARADGDATSRRTSGVAAKDRKWFVSRVRVERRREGGEAPDERRAQAADLVVDDLARLGDLKAPAGGRSGQDRIALGDAQRLEMLGGRKFPAVVKVRLDVRLVARDDAVGDPITSATRRQLGTVPLIWK